MSAIESAVSWVDVSVAVDIMSLLGTKLGEKVGSDAVRFDVSAKLEEKERRNGRIIVSFGLTVRTKPSVVKYEVEGSATVTGKDTLISKMLDIDPKSKIPFIFHRVYQHAFTAIYMLASILGTIYPPPDLLSSGEQSIPVKNLSREENVGVERAVDVAEVGKAAEEVKSVKPAPEVKPEDSIAQQPAAAQ